MSVPTLTAREARWLRATRLTSLLLAGTDGPGGEPAQTPPDVPGAGTRTVAGVVDWFGAMQGQDLASVMWSLGLRTGLSRSAVASAFESGAFVRTWPMRGTLHVVPGPDARWMVEHLGVRALAGGRARRQTLGLEERDADRAADLLGEALAGGRAMTRAECVALLEESGIPAARQRAYHLLWYSSQRGVTCVGPNRGKEQTFVLLDDFAPPGPRLDRPAALATIAERFVRSHGPVTAYDLARWADLSMADARAGLAAAEGTQTVSIGGRDLHLADRLLEADGRPMDFIPAESEEPTRSAENDRGPVLPALALPGFDELVLGYRDRTAQLAADHERIVSPGGNGTFANTLVLEGRVVGTWRRRELTRTVDITAMPFGHLPARQRERLEGAFDRFGTYVDRSARVTWTDSPPPGPD